MCLKLSEETSSQSSVLRITSNIKIRPLICRSNQTSILVSDWESQCLLKWANSTRNTEYQPEKLRLLTKLIHQQKSLNSIHVQRINTFKSSETNIKSKQLNGSLVTLCALMASDRKPYRANTFLKSSKPLSLA